MKTYKLQKDSGESMAVQGILLFLLIVGSIYTLITIDFDFTAFIFLSFGTLAFIAIFLSVLQKLGNKEEYFLKVDIQDDRIILDAKTYLFKEIDAFVFNHYQEHGNYYGYIYSVIGGEKDVFLYSREFKRNNYLSEEMMVEIYTRLLKSYEEYKKEHPTQAKKPKTPTSKKKLWGVLESINVAPNSLYYTYNGNYDVNMFFLLAFALMMAIPAFLINYDTIYFNQDIQKSLYNFYFFSDFKEYKAHGADVAVIAWVGFYIAMIDMFLKQRFKILFFMSYDGSIIRVGEVAIALMAILYTFLLIMYFDGEEIVGLSSISIMLFYLILSAYLEHKKHKLRFFYFIPFLTLLLINAVLLAIFIYTNYIGQLT